MVMGLASEAGGGSPRETLPGGSMGKRWIVLGIPSLATFRHIALRDKTNRNLIKDLKEEEGPPSPAGL